jgi:SAM-dependent methyltransferase
MRLDKEIQENSYFKYRNADVPSNEKIIPHWIRSEIESKELKILDYGCGYGDILCSLRNEDYKNIYGVDIENNAIKHCIKKVLNVKKLDLNKLKNPFDISFDIIIMSHVIEHIDKNQIINTLSIIRKEFLDRKGKLLIAVPNAQSNTSAYWAYEDFTHSTLFTSGSLFYVLKGAEFNNIEFIDIDSTLGGQSVIKKIIKKFFLKLYIFNKKFWNRATSSSYHDASPMIFSYEIKCKASN